MPASTTAAGTAGGGATGRGGAGGAPVDPGQPIGFATLNGGTTGGKGASTDGIFTRFTLPMPAGYAHMPGDEVVVKDSKSGEQVTVKRAALVETIAGRPSGLMPWRIARTQSTSR